MLSRVTQLAQSLSRGTVFYYSIDISLGRIVLLQGTLGGFGLELGVLSFYLSLKYIPVK